EKATKYDVSSFIRDYLSIKLQYIPVIKKTYQEFKKYHLSLSIGKEELLEDLLAYAERYEQIITGKSKMKTIEPVLTRLLFYEAKVIRPFVLEVLRLAESSQKKEAILSEEEVLEILNTVESYIFRRQICD